MAAFEGMLLVDKPSGPTSHDVVARIRRLTGQRRVGHAGTLDPAASGLLPLVLGRATRLVRFLPHSPKRYLGTLRLGLTTDTDDITGNVVARHPGPLPDAGRVAAAAEPLRGKGMQYPPAVSARKVGGQRLYRLARRGVRVRVDPRPVEVSRFELSPVGAAAEWRFVAEVSAGTYIRSLVRDLGVSLGCGATLTELRRTAIGPMRIEDALTLEQPATAAPERLSEAVIPLGSMPLVPPPLRLATPEQVRRFRHGSVLPTGPVTGSGMVTVLDPEGRLLGVGEALEGRLHARVVLG